MTSELRQDACTRDWVVIAPGRKYRPHSATEGFQNQAVPPDCPFCPGHEQETRLADHRLPADLAFMASRPLPLVRSPGVMH